MVINLVIGESANAKAAARRAVVKYIAWYNGTRPPSTLGYCSPAEFEEQNKLKKVA